MYEKTTLPNGVRIVTGPMTGVRSVSLIFYYGVGSRFERPAIAGVSHFLEHMLFKGTERRPDPMHISQEIEGSAAFSTPRPAVSRPTIGARYRAPTSPWPTTCWPTSFATR